MHATEKITYTDDQQRAIEKICHWYFNTKKTMFRLGGFAGTGKTTIAGSLAEILGVKIDAVAPTGKAAQRMTQKGIDAETIHSYIYDFEGKSKFTDQRTGEARQILHFGQKEDGRHGEAPLTLCDEASMVSGDLHDDLYRCVAEDEGRLLYFGDHGQLAPVGRDPGIMKDPDVRLETIMRQAADNPILAFAHRVRMKAGLRDNLDLVDNERLRIVGKTPADRVAGYAIESGVDQIIVPFHRIRHRVNERMRARLQKTGLLAEGDRVVARLNNRKQHIFNGNQFEIVGTPQHDPTYSSEIRDTKFIATLRSLDSDRVWENMNLFLPGPDGDWNDGCYKQANIAIDYAYAITCHTAQGSEWDNVLVIYAPCRAWSNERWLYTASTRAAKKLTVMAG